MAERLMTIRPFTVEIVVYDDGCSAVSKYWRDDMGKLTYEGRVFLDEHQTARMLASVPYKMNSLPPEPDEFDKLLAEVNPANG